MDDKEQLIQSGYEVVKGTSKVQDQDKEREIRMTKNRKF